MESPFLTIIIPTFNSAKTLQRALDSILVQHFSDWEIRIIDGASSDSTLTIIRENAEKDQRIHFISEADKGIYDAMNKGVRSAKGEWVYFLGSDDCLDGAGVLSSMLPETKGAGCDLLYGDIKSNIGIYGGAFSWDRLLEDNFSHQAAFYHRALFTKIGDFNIRYRAFADWDFNIRCYLDKTVRIKYIPRLVAWFSPGGVSSIYDIVFLREVLIPLKLKRLEETGVKTLRSIRLYDNWWRLLRNAKIREEAELKTCAEQMELPAALQRMVRWQRRLTAETLKKGAYSKFFMCLSYAGNFLSGAL